MTMGMVVMVASRMVGYLLILFMNIIYMDGSLSVDFDDREM